MMVMMMMMQKGTHVPEMTLMSIWLVECALKIDGEEPCIASVAAACATAVAGDDGICW